MVYAIILIAVGMIFSALLLLIPGSATDRVALMLTMLNILITTFALWVVIPEQVNAYKQITVTDPTD